MAARGGPGECPAALLPDSVFGGYGRAHRDHRGNHRRLLAGKIMKGSGYGVLMDLVLGLVGGLIGGFVVNALGMSASGGSSGRFIVSTLGAVLLVWIVRLASGNRARI